MRISDWSSDVCSSDLTPGAEEVSVAEVAPTPESVRAELVEAPSLTSEEKSSPSTSSGQAGHGKSVLASPAVRARAKDLGVVLSQVHTEGDSVRQANLDAFLRNSGGQGHPSPAASRARTAEPIRIPGMSPNLP